MKDQMYDELKLERQIKQQFGLDIDIRQFITGNVPVGRNVEATVFLTTRKQLYVYINGQSKLLLTDIKKIIARMGLKAELFIPPKGQPQYFDEIGQIKFSEVFPGRHHVTAKDLIFYRTLAPYNPALVQIKEVKNGEIYQYDSDARSGWRSATKFAYRRIKTSS